MPRAIPVSPGDEFTRFTVIREISPGDRGRRVLCKCQCGKVRVKYLSDLRKKNARSCGCLRKDMVTAKNTSHGESTRPEYKHWKAMRGRCLTRSHGKYPQYGGRGILVSPCWNSFAQFLQDMGPIPGPDYSLDRYPNRHGNYEPSNVRWATRSQQMRNRDCMDYMQYQGSRVLVIDVADNCGISAAAIRGRISRGWSIEEATNIPTKMGNNQCTRQKR